MRSQRAELLDTLERIREVPILVIGDVILDRYVWGSVDRISPEAPVPVVDVRRVEDRLGGAANVARNLRSIGARASLCGFIGDDDEGKAILSLLEKDGIDRDGVMIDRGRPTSLKTRVMASRQQIVRIDREKKDALGSGLREGFAAMVEAHIGASRGIVLSDYGKGAVSEPLIRKLAEARAAGSVGFRAPAPAAKSSKANSASAATSSGPRPLVLDPHPTNYAIYREIPVVKPNRKEAEAAVGFVIADRSAATMAGEVLLKLWNSDMVMVTLGEGGLMILERGAKEPLFLETLAREVFDVSGAGDTVTALFTAALSVGASPLVAGDLANIGAGIVVSEVGTVAASRQRIEQEIGRLAV